ncbi:hypothetical protein [Micromonospora echinospora]|uniref:hypothetical protein n=1 Tax=Micromonospora echinospora TaxID=1877 RepID=UPI003A885E7D
MADLRQRAASATRDHNPAAATAVFNLAALLASDCGLPDLARQWSIRLACAALTHPPNDFQAARNSLEPIINLARLRTRAGDGTGAWATLEELYRAITSRTDTTIDGITVPASRLAAERAEHHQLRRWLWAVLLSSGAHALAVAGRWDDAYHRLNQYKGIGRRMLDGRQMAVIAHHTTDRHSQALALLRETEPGEPWEHAVTSCLALLCQQTTISIEHDQAVYAYQALNLATTGLTVFHTRLGLSLIDALGDIHQPAAQPIAAGLIERATGDGYAARDLLAHPGCRNILTQRQAEQLMACVAACGLGAGAIPSPFLTELAEALDIAERLANRTSTTPSSPRPTAPNTRTPT